MSGAKLEGVRALVVGGGCPCFSELARTLAEQGLVWCTTPRAADTIVVGGVIPPTLIPRLVRLHSEVPPPCRLIAVGACACSGGLFAEHGGAVVAGLGQIFDDALEVPGCPPPVGELARLLARHEAP